MTALAAKYSIRRSTVSDLLSRSEVPRRLPRTLDSVGAQRAVELYGQGWSLQRVAEQLGFNAETIRTHLKRHGVVLRSSNQPRQ